MISSINGILDMPIIPEFGLKNQHSPAAGRCAEQHIIPTERSSGGMKGIIVIFFLIIISCWFYIQPYIFKDIEIPYNDLKHGDFSPNMLEMTQNAPMKLLNDNMKYNFGRFLYPVQYPELHKLNSLQSIFQRKEWHFIAVSDGTLLIGLAVANLGYIETAFIYFCDMKSGVNDKISFVLPGGMGSAHVASSSISSNDCSSFASSMASFNISMCYHEQLQSWKLVGGGVLEKKSSLYFDISLKRTGFGEFSMIYPLGPNRAAYTHKTSSLSAEGLISRTTPQSPLYQPFVGTGLTDFSRTMARTFTEWFWVAFSFNNLRSDCESQTCDSSFHDFHGVQLSQGVYRYPPHSRDAVSGDVGDLENIIWVHQKPYYLNSNLIFTVSDGGEKIIISPGQNQLRMGRQIEIISADKRLHLTYLPISQMPTELSTPIFSGALLHSYGVYSGFIIGLNEEKIEFENVPGIFEDHYAKW